MKKLAQTFRDLEVYKESFHLQQEIFRATKTWPSEERYAWTDQIRRSSRSIGSNIAESWAKRRYAAHFLSKLTDADGEIQETYHWLDTAFACDYLSNEAHRIFTAKLESVGRMLGSMIQQYESFTHS